MPARKSAKTQSPPPVNRTRRFVLGFSGICFVLLVSFGGLEAGLRLGGYGYDPSFFQKTLIDGRECYIENTKFGFRFFPPEIARVPSPVVFPVQKADKTFRIFLFGESAALGDPEPAFGVGRFLTTLLEQRFQGERFEVIPAAMTAINSHVLLPIARECRHLDGDLWIVYMGNNEFVGPFGASTVFGARGAPWRLVRATLALKATRTGQLLDAVARKLTHKSAAIEWGSLKMFAENKVAPTDRRRQTIYKNFQQNFDDLLAAGKKAGIKVIASSVAVNLKDCAPFASMDDAESFFQLGRTNLAVGNEKAARENFEQARDRDALPFRTDSTINRVIQQSAQAEGADYIDAATLLSAPKIPGDDLFYEHVHLNFEGNYRLAKILGEEVIHALPYAIKKNDPKSWGSFEECSRRLALTEWDERRVYEEVQRRIAQPPFVAQSNHTNQVETIRQKLTSLRTRMTPDRFAEAKQTYTQALKNDGRDFYLRGNYAKLLEDNNDPRGAIAQWDEVRKLLPHEPAAYYYEGKLLGQVGDNSAAMTNLAHALEIRPDLLEAMDEQSKIFLRTGKPNDALIILDHMAQLRPDNSRVCVGRAEALAQLNRRPEAVQQLEKAIALQPANWEARYLLGVELATQNKIAEAKQQFATVFQLRLDYPLAHLNLGVALAKENNLRDAVREFQQTLRFDPNNARARDFLRQLGVTNNSPNIEK